MSIVADHYRFVVGVDTHAATHTYALVEAPSGKQLGQATFPTTAAGLARAEAWLARRTSGDLDGMLVSAEGTGSYGAMMGQRLAQIGYRVVEAPAPSAKRLRGKGKTDTLDAITAARSSLIMEMEDLRDRRAGELQTALKVLTPRTRAAQRRSTAVDQRVDRVAAHPRFGYRCPQSADTFPDHSRRCLATT